jgi:acyl-CoA reductase-like NAD-dependent aldehyde dehydrogenase
MTEQLADAGAAAATLPLAPGELFVGANGWHRSPSATSTSSKPATEKRITAVARTDEHDVDRAVRVATAVFDPSAPVASRPAFGGFK